MKLSPAGLDFIVSFEGKHRALGDGRYIAYRCPAGVWTIHAGVTEGVRPGMIVTEAEGNAMFMRELAKFEGAVTRLARVDLNQNEYDALVSFAYNCGENALARSTILRKLNAGDRRGAAAAFALWNKGGGRVLPGLVRRRAAEAALFLTPAETADEPIMPQAVTSEEPAPGLLHPRVHLEMREQSLWYRIKHRAAKALGVGGGGGLLAASQTEADPVSIAGTVLTFLKTYGLELAALAAVAVIAIEAMQYSQRSKGLEQ